MIQQSDALILAHVLHLLRKYLGEYVHGLSSEALRISVWKGDVVLKDLKLKSEALNALKLPVTVKAGFLGTITLKVPWKSLGKEPVIVLIDKVFILANPATDGRFLKVQIISYLTSYNLNRILYDFSPTLLNSPAGNSWLGSLISTIIGNLKISISNVHIRYEDSVSNPGHPFSCGITLAKLAAFTMDEHGNETFDTSGALDKLRKSLQLERLAVYHDSNRDPWRLDKKWEDLSPKEWVEIFQDGINESSKSRNSVSPWAQERNYLVSPINGVLKYHRLGNKEREDSDVPFEKASFVIADVSLAVTEAQYHDWIKLMEAISAYRTRVEISHLRPMVPVSEGPRLWWRYGAQAGLQQKKMCYRFSWEQIQNLCHLRRRYVQLYADSLQGSDIDNSEQKEIEKDLDAKVILLWRFLAHAKVESVKSKEAAEQRMLKKRSWFPVRWSVSVTQSVLEERLTKEEWEAVNKLLSFQPDDDLVQSGKDVQSMIHYLINVSISKAAARIVNIDNIEIVCGRFENLNVSTKLKQKSTHCDVTLQYYGFSTPEGSLAQSVSSEQKVNALQATFVHTPAGESVDWRLSATISPCHVTVLMESYDRFLHFVKRSTAVSPTVALETATALQQKIEEVTRKAQEQFQMVLEEQSRFALDIDLDAPKVSVPIKSCSSNAIDSYLLLDLGHFTLQTKEDGQLHDHRDSLFSRFYISGRDIAAFFADCGSRTQPFDWGSRPPFSPSSEDADKFYSLIDRCGIAVIVDQIKVPRPNHPSTRISVQIPSLGIHFSPNRYFRLNELLNLLNGAMHSDDQHAVEHLQTGLVPWNPPDLATEARILVWKGIGYSVATWQPCFLVLSGLHLYVLESETSQSYQRCTSMAGKQVCDVPSTNVGGSLCCIAVSTRGMDIQKALESFSALIVEFPNEEEKSTWLRGLVQSTYQASAPASVDILDGLTDGLVDFAESPASNAKAADLVLNGTVVETKLSVYGKFGDEEHERVQEKIILELLAGGGKMHLSSCGSDLAIKVKLNSLKIKDELQGSLYTHSQYIACSVIMDQHPSSNPNLELQGKDMLAATVDEDDVFNDALSDFTILHDNAEILTHEMDPSHVNIVPSDVFYEAMGSDDSDFVSVTFLRRSPGSPDYDGVDTQMSVQMAKLEFYCNRPTLVALISFGVDMSAVISGESGTNIENPTDGPSGDKDKGEEHGHAASIKGLLGYGKGRVVFHLNMNVDSVTMFLNKEDGSQLAMFVQENFLLDFKVHPSSLSIEGTLGNLRVCDLSLGSDHRWGWLCDLRNEEAESLIQFAFISYSVGDDDYEGYDYSLSGRLSAVRIIFLYRFVQEITAYFMELATPRAEEAIQLVDKVAGIEWLIQKYEVDGASAIRFNLTLENPIIVVPQNSLSKDFLQLDLGLLRIKNTIVWHGCPEKDPSAVHLDVLDAEVLGINMAVGIDGSVGKPMIREGRGVHIFVRRSLRDVFRKVPTFALEVKVGSLHAVMSDKEYTVILNCALMNLSEQPTLPPSFRNSNSSAKDTIKLLADKVNMNSQVLLSRTVTTMAVEMDYALLELCYGADKESPLAHVTLEGLWVSYRMTSLSEADLYVTLPRFSILDNRPNTKAEMRLMLGSCTDVPKQMSPEHNDDLPNSTMFLLDGRWRLSSQSFVVRVQQPRVLVVPDFLLAVCEFFVPALGTITGRDEMMDRKNDPISKKKNIVLSAPLYKQTEDIVQLSPSRQLVVDAVGIDEYTYDGCGKTIRLASGKEEKESHFFPLRPIIIIGRGKHLRFINVKFENGLLLGKYTYLSNDSSYSVSQEDEVEISFIDDNSRDRNRQDSINLEELSHTSHTSGTVQCESNAIPSLSFEAQVVSPEFTFNDSSKSFLDDSSHGEKLLRAKMDVSFMFASKEDDRWIRALVKDLSVEAGSGLVVLDPMDVSGGFTSVKDKMNISIVSTDIYAHLSLGVISLLLNLQSQASAALQFGNTDPLALCTNFDRIWVSPKENGRLSNLTFWRPRAPSNYVVLGDCVTSRPSPPSQSVLAVSNAYDRVRKPLGFKLIGSFSSIQGQQSGEVPSNIDGDCSLWLPISPPGYLALGSVAHVGSQPPPTHIVHCVRSDLVTSTTVLECLLNSSANHLFESGFSIWRLDNCLGSFYAHPSADCPSKDYCFDLNHLLLWNSSQRQSSSNESLLDFNSQQETSLRSSDHGATSSAGWDVLRSISKPSAHYMSTPNFERIWWERGGDLRRPFSIWRPIPRLGYAILGDCITEGLEPPPLGIIFKADDPEISAKPVQFTKVAHIGKKGPEEVFFWYPIAPPGYAAVGCLVTLHDEAPSLESVSCPRMDLVSQASIAEVPISRSSSSKGSNCWSIWKIENQACTFLARSDLKKPSNSLGFAIGDSVKPKTRDNVTADMKIRCFSLTILDSFCGMMTPLFDATITNIKLASHGRLDAMNAVLISSFAASTFNINLEAWEPLVEPFDGIFKLETYETNLSQSVTIAKRMRVAATTILNVNLSAANVDTLAQATASWRKHRELEEKAMRLYEEATGPDESVQKSAQLALDEDDFQTVIVENKLGCDVYLKRMEDNSDMINLLHDNGRATLSIPPPRYSDRLNVSDESREPRCYVGIQIVEAKGLPLVDDGNSHRYFCALRLLMENQEANPQKVFPQSARTRCVKPVTIKVNGFDEGTAKWNELFIFEFPRKGMAKLEVEVTNLAAKAGKGEVVGACSLSVGHGVGMLKKVASVKMLHQTSDVQSIKSYPLRRKGQNSGVMHSDSCLLVSTSFIEKSMVTDFDNKQGDESDLNGDMGFWVALGPEGPWDGFRSSLPLSVITRKLKDDFVALEVSMKNGKKHAVFRGLATVTNDSDVTLDISTCHVSVIYGHDSSRTSRSNVVVEEIFENQQYHPVSGWGNDGNNSPRRWSTRDFSFSSREFFEPPLPPGWKWASTWTVDKSQFVDTDGWAYGPDYQTLKWPPSSPKSGTKSSRDAVRRRRWTRTRQEDERAIKNQSFLDITICPGGSAVLPWRSISRDSNQCLLIRPSSDHSQVSYAWGRPVSVEKDSSSVDQASVSRQSTLKHANKTQTSPLRLDQLEKKDLLWCCPGSNGGLFWLSIGTDASVLQSDLNTPVYDWKVSATAPLRLENRLPCSAEFKIWERLRDGKNIERQHGSVSARGTVQICSADIQNPIYIMLFLECGWVMERDPVPILDMAFGNHVSSFCLLHQQRKRRLRVSIERDLGGSAAAPKTIRFFVPYWINNDSSLSLAYRVVETEPLESPDMDSLLGSKSFKSIRSASKYHSTSMVGGPVDMKRNIQVLEAIEDTSPIPSMLSPQDYIGRGGVSLFSSRNDMYLSPRVGIAVALRNCDNFSPGVSLLELEKKQRVDVRALDSNGAYFKLSAVLHMTSDRTKVIHFQPHTMFMNRVGCSVCVQQCDTESLEWLHPTAPPRHFGWQSGVPELIKLRMNGYQWSAPFTIGSEGLMSVCLRSELGSEYKNLSIEVRGGAKTSRYEVILRPCSFSSPYRIENHSFFLPLHFRQVNGSNDSWRSLLPNAATSFSWEDLGRERYLELLIDGDDPLKSLKYDIDEIKDHQPIQVSGGPRRSLRVTIVREEKVNVVKISDWMPENDVPALLDRSVSFVQQVSESKYQPSTLVSDSEFHFILEVVELGLSIVDHTPEEILYLSLKSFLLSYSTGLGSGISRLKMRMGGIQIDNQLPLTPMPVLFRPQRVGEDSDYILKLSMTQQSSGSLDLCIYPYIGLQVKNTALLVNIHEPIIWRLHGLVRQANISRIFDSQTSSVSVDPIIQIGVLNISECRFKVTMVMSPTQRPAGVLGFWASLMTALGNTENMPVRVNQRFQENVSLRHSVLVSNTISNIKKDVLSQPLQLLSGVDILGNASSALGHMSKGVAALSMDKKFIQSRQRQDNKGVEDFGDVIREGGGALAKGIFRGVTGILTKPLEGAKASGVEGFVQEGANAMRMKIAAAIASEDQLLRRRLPRAIGGDNLLRPYDEYKAKGQVILQLAESGSFLVDMFKVRGKFALTDAYEDHFALPKGRIVLITHRRVILLQQPSNLIAQKKFNPARDPCSVIWDVVWDDLVTMELTHGKKDHPIAPPSRVILYLHSKSVENAKDHHRIIKCCRDSNQAFEVYSALELARSTYSPQPSTAAGKRKVTRPYAPMIDSVIPKGGYILSPQQMPSPIPGYSTLGAVNND
ncbi:calcium-dependent lipid-binding family protein [Perilla frutescens var. hirtella]|nr:calcium-dependent lipid-binding family protein [Perilla frutescens var. hirtella]